MGTNGHSADLYTPRQSTPTSIRCQPDHPAAPATRWRRSARLESPGAPKIAEPATSSGQHVATKIAFLREQVKEAKRVYLYHIRTQGQLADLMTKPLAASIFHPLASFMIA